MTVTPLVVALIAFGLAIHALPWDAMQRTAQRLRTLPAPAFALGLAVMLVVDAMRYEGVAPFIYFRF
jgi:alginate O-acetyltransferase complex protein AlgI